MFTHLSILPSIGLLALALLVSSACLAEAKTEAVNMSGAASSSEEIQAAKPVLRHFNLGAFQIGQHRPT